MQFAAVIASLLIAACIAWAGSHNGRSVAGLPVFAVCAALAFLINWVAFVPAYLRQSERSYDLVGSITYLLLVGLGLSLGNHRDPRSVLIALCVCAWALRLGSFLVERIRRAGKDDRFDKLKRSASRFFLTWTLQGLWVFVTLSAALAAMTSASTVPLGAVGIAGVLLWLAGFAIEVVADQQKRRFRLGKHNDARFISNGLWAWSRHPNYFGEILLWTGIAVAAYPALSGWQLVTLVSPLFVFLLLTRVSGVPLLEAKADERWASDPAYQTYKNATPVLFPRPPRRVQQQS